MKFGYFRNKNQISVKISIYCHMMTLSILNYIFMTLSAVSLPNFHFSNHLTRL